MRQVVLSPIAASAPADEKLRWCIDAIQKIALASRTDDPNVIADGFTASNVTEVRTLDADCGVLANLAAAQAAIDATRDVLLTFITDLKKRGAKQR